MTSTPKEEWKEQLNKSKITNHVSGRHLVLISPKEDIYDDNEYSFLDEYISRIIKTAVAAERARIAEQLKDIPLHECYEGCINCGETEAQEHFRSVALSLLQTP